MTTEKTRLTAEQFSEFPGDGCHRYELLDGEVVEMTPPGGRHGGVAARITLRLGAYIETEELDFEVTTELGVILQRRPDRVRAPDACVIARSRLPNGELPDAYLETVPDLIIEVVSPNDRAAEVQEKVEEWLHGGARLVWICHPSTRTFYAYRGLSDVRVFRAGDTLDADPVLPGFAVQVERLFP